jgi:hypothetical protein
MAGEEIDAQIGGECSPAPLGLSTHLSYRRHIHETHEQDAFNWMFRSLPQRNRHRPGANAGYRERPCNRPKLPKITLVTSWFRCRRGALASNLTTPAAGSRKHGVRPTSTGKGKPHRTRASSTRASILRTRSTRVRRTCTRPVTRTGATASPTRANCIGCKMKTPTHAGWRFCARFSVFSFPKLTLDHASVCISRGVFTGEPEHGR